MKDSRHEEREVARAYISKIQQRETPYFREVAGINLKIEKCIYPTGKIGELFTRAIDSIEDDISQATKVLDYGTGSGFLAIYTAKKGASVIAVDKSYASINCAKENAKLNGVESKIDFRLGDELSSISPDEKNKKEKQAKEQYLEAIHILNKIPKSIEMDKRLKMAQIAIKNTGKVR